jgi:hypothetical protein
MAGSWSKSETLEDRFMKYIFIDTNSGCWLWTGNVDHYGYGRLGYKMKSYRASRAAMLIFNGKDPGKLFVCHKCDNPLCANPEHLFLGTQKDNMQDCKNKKRQNAGSKNGSAKLQESDIPKIFEMAKSGATHLEISKVFSVSRSNIGSILNKKRWSQHGGILSHSQQ